MVRRKDGVYCVEGSTPNAGQQSARGVLDGCQDIIVHVYCRHLPHVVIGICLHQASWKRWDHESLHSMET